MGRDRFFATLWRTSRAVFALETVRSFDGKRGQRGDVVPSTPNGPTAAVRSVCAPGSISPPARQRNTPMMPTSKPRHWLFGRNPARSIAQVRAARRRRAAFECLEGRALLSLTPTAISVTASDAAPVYGQSETFTATVTTPSGDPTPGPTDGTVTFYDGNTPLGTAQSLSASQPADGHVDHPGRCGRRARTRSPPAYSGTSDFAASTCSGVSPPRTAKRPGRGGQRGGGRPGTCSSRPGDKFSRAGHVGDAPGQTTAPPSSMAPRAWQWTARGRLHRRLLQQPGGGGAEVGAADHRRLRAQFPRGRGGGRRFIADSFNNRVVEVPKSGRRRPSAPGSLAPLAWRWTARGTCSSPRTTACLR